MKLGRVILLSALAAAVTGCASPVPMADNFPLSVQKVARVAHHWDVVADDVVSQTLSSIDKAPELQRRPIFIEPADTGSAFDRAFRNFLITRFVDKGQFVNVCKTPLQEKAGFVQAPGLPPVNVQYETQIVRHRGPIPPYRPGALTWLAANVAAIYNLAAVNHSRDFTAIAGAGIIVADDIVAGHAAHPTHTELILTTTITEDNRYVMRKSDVYYIPDADTSLFMRQVAQHSRCEKSNVAQSVPAQSNLAEQDAKEQIRRDLYAREMKRINQDWRPHLDEFYSKQQNTDF
jgi:hypothetical protein